MASELHKFASAKLIFSKTLRTLANTNTSQALSAVKHYAMNIWMWVNW